MVDGRAEEVLQSWREVQRVPPLEAGAVHVWRVRVEGAVEATASLSAEENYRASRLQGRARARFIATRAALRERLAGYLGRSASSIRFEYGATGKPVLVEGEDVHFSVAHSGDVALIAAARAAAVGVDLERIRPVPRRARVAARVLAPPSATALEALDAGVRDDAFIWAWTQREAYVKAIGGGVLRSEDPLPLLWPPRQCVEAGWSIFPLAAHAGHRACLVAEGRPQLLLLEMR